jgi:3-oxoacyl-[acyl-carrier protein] reductase
MQSKSQGITVAEARALREQSIPAGRIGDAAEVGDACAYLCSAQASYITAQNLSIDGGVFPGTF